MSSSRPGGGLLIRTGEGGLAAATGVISPNTSNVNPSSGTAGLLGRAGDTTGLSKGVGRRPVPGDLPSGDVTGDRGERAIEYSTASLARSVGEGTEERAIEYMRSSLER